MSVAYVVVALVTVAANMFSGIAAITRLKPIMEVLRLGCTWQSSGGVPAGTA